MTRWFKSPVNADLPAPRIDAFLAEVGEVCRKHGFCIEHEDGHGAFIVAPLRPDDDPLDWLGDAHVVGVKPEDA